MNNDRITEELQAEITRLKDELEKAQAELRELGEARQALLFMLEDLNESKTHIERAKKEWEGIFDAIADPIFTHDNEFRIVRVNQAYQKMAGMSYNDIIGRPYYEVFPKMDGPFKMCLRALKSQEEEEEEEDFIPSIDKIFKVRFYPINDAEGKYLYSIHILEDITEIKRSEEKLKQEIDMTTHLLMIAEATAHTIDIDKLMERVVHCTHNVMGCDYCLSYLWDKNSLVFRPTRQYGLAHEIVPSFMTEAIDIKMELLKKAMEEKKPIIGMLKGMPHGDEAKYVYIGMQSAAQVFKYLPEISTITLVPLIGRKDYLGIIIGIFKTHKHFTERDVRILEGISHQVSTALDEARLFKDSVEKTIDLSKKIETIRIMHEIDRSILSTLNSNEILEIVTMMTGKIMQCDRATISIIDKERKGFIYTAGFGVESVPKGQFIPFKDTSALEVIETGMPQYTANMNEIKDPLPLETVLVKEGFLSQIRVPLSVKGEIIGTLNVGAKRPSAFTTEDLSTLEKIASQISVALENARLVSDLEELFIGTVKSLSSAIDAKSPWTAGHSERVTRYAISIGKEMGLSEKELRTLELAGLLHDIGKIGTYETILNKSDKLTSEEFMIVKQHPVKGAEILKPIKQLNDVISGVRHHHEHYDGTGYPDAMAGKDIPILARILNVADTVDAMKADRPYRKGKDMKAIAAELKRCSGTQFDTDVVEVFLKMRIEE